MVKIRNDFPQSYPFASPPEHRQALERGAQAFKQALDSISANFEPQFKATNILRGQSGVQSGGAASYDQLIRVDPQGATMMLALPPPNPADAGRGFRVACVGSGTIGLRTSATRVNGLTQYFYPNTEGLFEVRFDGSEFVTFPANPPTWAPLGTATGQAMTWNGSTGAFGNPNFYQLPLQAGSIKAGPSAGMSGLINMGRGVAGEIHAPGLTTGDVTVLQLSAITETIRLGDATSGVVIDRNSAVRLRPASGADRFVASATGADCLTPYFSVATGAATSGVVRIPNNQDIMAAGPSGANVQMIGVGSNGKIIVGYVGSPNVSIDLTGGPSGFAYTESIGASGGIQLAGPSGPMYVGGVALPRDQFDAANKAYADADIKLHWRGVVGTMSPTQPRYIPENDFEPGNIGLYTAANAMSIREPGVAGVARRMHVFRYGSPTGPVPSPGPSGSCTGAGAFIYSLERNGTAVATGSVGTLASYFAVSMVASYAATDQLAIGVRAPSGFTWGPTFLSAHHIVLEGYAN